MTQLYNSVRLVSSSLSVCTCDIRITNWWYAITSKEYRVVRVRTAGRMSAMIGLCQLILHVPSSRTIQVFLFEVSRSKWWYALITVFYLCNLKKIPSNKKPTRVCFLKWFLNNCKCAKNNFERNKKKYLLLKYIKMRL